MAEIAERWLPDESSARVARGDEWQMWSVRRRL